MLALPYFFLFEFMGPAIEIQGYIMVLLAMVMGIFNQKVAVMLFASVILLGINISLLSLLIAEKESHYFTFTDMLKLMAIMVFENVGFRQLVSIWRFLGQMKAVTSKEGWGSVRRKEIKT